MMHFVRVLLWLPYLVVQLVGWVLGVVVVSWLASRQSWKTRPSQVPNWKDKNVVAWKPNWAWPWGNEEDGVTGAKWYRDLHPEWSDTKKAIMWSAFRNPFNNMRFIPYINPTLTPSKIRSLTRGNWDFTWQRIHSGFRWFPKIGGKTFRFWIGWKLKPEDANGVADTDFRKYGVGFAVQFKRVKEVA